MLLINRFVKCGSVQQGEKKIEKRKKTNGLTHKLPLTHKTQFSFTTQEEYNLTFELFLLRQNVEIICYFSLAYGLQTTVVFSQHTKWFNTPINR